MEDSDVHKLHDFLYWDAKQGGDGEDAKHKGSPSPDICTDNEDEHEDGEGYSDCCTVNLFLPSSPPAFPPSLSLSLSFSLSLSLSLCLFLSLSLSQSPESRALNPEPDLGCRQQSPEHKAQGSEPKR